MKVLKRLAEIKKTGFKDIREKRFYELKEKLKNMKNKKGSIYGTGNHTKLVLNLIKDIDVNICGLIDIDKSQIGKKIFGYNVHEIDDIKNSIDFIIISSDVYQEIIYDRIKNIEKSGVELIKIYRKEDFVDTERTYLYDDDELNIKSTIYYKSFIEHINRYMFCIPFTLNKEVLDIACGCGYGTEIISDSAKHIVGVDIDEKTIKYANKYFKTQNNEFVCSSIEKYFSNEKYDAVLSFETIEHIDDDKLYISKIKSMMKTDGCFVVSTPITKKDRGVNKFNPYHINEYTEERFLKLLNNNFKKVILYVQYSDAGSIVFREAVDELIPYKHIMLAVCFGIREN